jgi:hypothetical protein
VELPTAVAILRALQNEGVQYVLVEGVALNLRTEGF